MRIAVGQCEGSAAALAEAPGSPQRCCRNVGGNEEDGQEATSGDSSKPDDDDAKRLEPSEYLNRYITAELQAYLDQTNKGRFSFNSEGRHVLHQLAEDFRKPSVTFSSQLWLDARWWRGGRSNRSAQHRCEVEAGSLSLEKIHRPKVKGAG